MKTCMLHHNWDWSNGAKKKITVTMHEELLQYLNHIMQIRRFLSKQI